MSKSEIIRRNLAHLGIILCHLSILGFVLMISGILSAIMVAMLFLGGLLLIVISVGTVFAVVPNYWDKLMGLASGSGVFMETFGKALPAISIASVLFCVASVFLTALDLKWDKAKPRFIISLVMVVILVLLLLALILGIVRGEAA